MTKEPQRTSAGRLGAYHIGSKSKISKARKRKEQRKKSKNRRLNASNNRRKRVLQAFWVFFQSLDLDPWEESLLNFVMTHIYMEFSKSIQSMKKHYFYSHQKPTKLVYEICLIPIVLWGKLEKSSWFLLYIGSAQLIRTYVFLKIGFWWKTPLPSTLRCLRKLLYQYSRAIFIHFGSFWTPYFKFLCKRCRENSKSSRRSARRHICCQCSYKRIKCESSGSTQRCTFFG